MECEGVELPCKAGGCEADNFLVQAWSDMCPRNKVVPGDNVVVSACFGNEFENNFVYLPADGTSGGIVLAVKASSMLIVNPSRTNHTILGNIVDQKRNLTWTVTGVYGPQGELERRCL
jgi:hypothetical protein